MKQNCINDAELILGYLSGNDQCFETLLKRYKGKVFGTIYAIVHDKYVAEDLFQEAFIRAVNHIRDRRYADDGRFNRWIVRIARNISIDYIRKAKNKPTITDTEGNDLFTYLQIPQASVEDLLIKKEDKGMVRRMIRQLPPDQQEVLIMRHYGQMSFKEIAETTNVSVNTALGRMRYAMLGMRKMMVQQSIGVQ
ncbi:MAG: sigma-70 family RNA polymerase sigma factor [Flavobacteriaceae bacterium]|nr:sigma-70 family RNA polymerase sigma factor [Flavobacteriaceae bacterium]